LSYTELKKHMRAQSMLRQVRSPESRQIKKNARGRARINIEANNAGEEHALGKMPTLHLTGKPEECRAKDPPKSAA